MYIYGKNPIIEALTRTPGRVQKIFIKESLEKNTKSEIETLARPHKIAIQEVQKDKLLALVGDVVHQGIVALVSDVALLDFKEWLSHFEIVGSPMIVLLDEIEDPHNVGAIIRSAAAFGVSAVLIGKHNQSPITSSVEKAAAGTIDRVPIVRIGNINDTLGKLKEKGFWVLGLDERGETLLTSTVFDTPTCIVIGGEGKGIREKTLMHCDIRIQIPMENNVESLNASVSTALVLYEWKKQKLN